MRCSRQVLDGVVLSALLVASAAEAEEERSAADVVGAPRPGDESGRIDREERDEGRLVGRALLFVPWVAFELAASPFRAGLWAYEHYELRERWMRTFFNEARTVGVYPQLRYDSEYGIGGGARFVARDLGGRGEYVTARAAAGGRHAWILDGSVHSGEWFGRVAMELAVEAERRPRDAFYGIGDADVGAAGPLPVDPQTHDVAIATRYRQQLARAALAVDVRLARQLHVRTAIAASELAFGPSESGIAIDDAYMAERIPGYGGVRQLYADVELAWDSRGRATRWEPPAIPATGWLAAIYGGRATVEEQPDFWRYGGDLQLFARIASGPRVIATRLQLEAVSGDIDAVPFDELPKLGGPARLRGYPTDRFRDRLAGLATVEYRWDLAKYVLAKLFVDAGRVARTADELVTSDLRAGYGVGIDLYTERSFVLRTSVASTIDGGVAFYLAFDPAFDRDSRVERR